MNGEKLSNINKINGFLKLNKEIRIGFFFLFLLFFNFKFSINGCAINASYSCKIINMYKYCERKIENLQAVESNLSKINEIPWNNKN